MEPRGLTADSDSPNLHAHMICPNCKSEYREGFIRCSDCDIPLVAHLPAEQRRKNDFVNVFETADPPLLAVVASFLRSKSIAYVVRGDASTRLGRGLRTYAQIWVAKTDEADARKCIRAAAASDAKIPRVSRRDNGYLFGSRITFPGRKGKTRKKEKQE